MLRRGILEPLKVLRLIGRRDFLFFNIVSKAVGQGGGDFAVESRASSIGRHVRDTRTTMIRRLPAKFSGFVFHASVAFIFPANPHPIHSFVTGDALSCHHARVVLLDGFVMLRRWLVILNLRDCVKNRQYSASRRDRGLASRYLSFSFSRRWSLAAPIHRGNRVAIPATIL
jgi:hypothetical protein